jgi:hypothetical protein
MKTQLCFVSLACVVSMAACGTSDLDVPQPPQDLTATAQVYTAPTGTVDPAQVQQIVADAQARVASSRLDTVAPVVRDALAGLRRRLDASNLPSDPAETPKRRHPDLRAVITAHRACEGGGSIDLTLVIENSRLQRAIWGTANACGPLNGSVSLFLQRALPEQAQDAAALVMLSGSEGVAGDFAVQGQAVAVRRAVADGEVIVAVGTDGVSVRGQNGTVTCALTATSCGPLSP